MGGADNKEQDCHETNLASSSGCSSDQCWRADDGWEPSVQDSLYNLYCSASDLNIKKVALCWVLISQPYPKHGLQECSSPEGGVSILIRAILVWLFVEYHSSKEFEGRMQTTCSIPKSHKRISKAAVTVLWQIALQ